MTNLASQLRDCRTAAERAVVLQKGQAPEVAMADLDPRELKKWQEELTTGFNDLEEHIDNVRDQLITISRMAANAPSYVRSKQTMPEIQEAMKMLRQIAGKFEQTMRSMGKAPSSTQVG